MILPFDQSRKQGLTYSFLLIHYDLAIQYRTQQNAYPTKFRINFDMYTAFVYGEKGVTLTLNLETCHTMDETVPKVLIELLVAP